MAEQAYADAVNATYATDGIAEKILAGLRATGKDPDALAPDDLAAVDQFHIGGKAATLTLARRAGISPAMHVLDVGGGIGGPARTLAREVGCTVTVLDLTAEYCRTGALLTARTGLSDRVTFQHGNALVMPFPDGQFDAVWTQHSSMNIADKAGLYREIARVLRPGGRLAIHEVMAGPVQPVHFPVPWAREPSVSFLLPPEAVRAAIHAAGFADIAWVDETEASIAFFRNRGAAGGNQPGPPPLGLHLLLGADAGARVSNFRRNLDENRVIVIQAVFTRA